MAQIKIVVTIESTLVRDAHAAVDAMDAYLRQHDGRVTHARLVPVQAVAREPAPEPAPVSRCSVCDEPAHASETDDLDRHPACRPRTVYRVNWDNGGSACGTFDLKFGSHDDAEAFGKEWANECNVRDFGTTEPDEDCYTFDVIEEEVIDDEAQEIDDGGRKAGLNRGQP